MEVVKPSLIVLVNEVEVMNSLSEDSIRLIHATRQIQAIKRVLQVQEIIQMNLDIQREFGHGNDDIVWDIGSLSALKIYRSEIIVYHSKDFDPIFVLRRFSDRVQSLLHTAQHRLQVNI